MNKKYPIIDLQSTTNESKLKKSLNNNGYLIYEGLETRNEFLNFAHLFGTCVKHPEADEDGILVITPDQSKNVGPSGFAFTRSEIPMHTDGPGVSQYDKFEGPAEILVLWYKHIQENGGRPLLCDGKAVYQSLDKNFPDVLHYLKSEQAGDFVTQPDHHYTGAIFEGNASHIKMRYKKSQKNEHTQILEQIIKENQFEINIQPGQGVVLDNRRMLHARTELTKAGHRELYHALVYSENNQKLFEPGFKI